MTIFCIWVTFLFSIVTEVVFPAVTKSVDNAMLSFLVSSEAKHAKQFFELLISLLVSNSNSFLSSIPSYQNNIFLIKKFLILV
jgi:hypothetical protein